MKTTIEVNGYQIIITEGEGNVSVSAVKDEETVEEFTLEFEGQDGEETQDNVEAQDGEIKPFAQEEAQDFPQAQAQDFAPQAQEEDEIKLESFNNFVKNRK